MYNLRDGEYANKTDFRYQSFVDTDIPGPWIFTS
jgi:hypothetical protein